MVWRGLVFDGVEMSDAFGLVRAIVNFILFECQGQRQNRFEERISYQIFSKLVFERSNEFKLQVVYE